MGVAVWPRCWRSTKRRPAGWCCAQSDSEEALARPPRHPTYYCELHGTATAAAAAPCRRGAGGGASV